ncbi:MAG: dTDP-glucose 4,6-dehydratase [Nitrospirae bacterium]|nr:dTDP-glucose 4,6-dehydratase [Nitrospirota bacterium]
MTRHTLLVTGGAGFIGSNFVRHMLAADADRRVVNLDLLTYAGRRENLDDLADHPRHLFVHGDIRDQALVNALMTGAHPDMAARGFDPVDRVAHLAAESHVDRSITGPEAFVSTNVHGTLVLLEGARAAWAEGDGGWRPGTRFLHVSTDEVYGSLGPEGCFTERTPLAPNSPYSASKAGSDLLARAYRETYGLPVVTTRCSNNYGPYQLPEKLIPVVIDRILDRRAIPVYGDGRNVRDWLFVLDHCKGLERVLEAGALGEVYNIGGHNEWANIDIVGLLCDRVDERAGLSGSRSLITFVTDRLGHDRRYAIDAGRMARELGWKPDHTFETGIAETVDWYLAHRDWVARAKAGL